MQLANLLRGSLDMDCNEIWENDTPRHPLGCSGCACIRWGCRCGKSSLCWTYVASIGLTERSGTGRTIARVAVDEKQIKVDGEKNWLYAAIDTESKLLLEIDVYSRRGTDPAAAFLHRLTEKHDVSDTGFLVDSGSYLTALFRHDLCGQRNYTDRNHIEKWFQTVSMRIDCFHSFWRGNPASARRWLKQFRHHYNHDRPN